MLSPPSLDERNLGRSRAFHAWAGHLFAALDAPAIQAGTADDASSAGCVLSDVGKSRIGCDAGGKRIEHIRVQETHFQNVFIIAWRQTRQRLDAGPLTGQGAGSSLPKG